MAAGEFVHGYCYGIPGLAANVRQMFDRKRDQGGGEGRDVPELGAK